VVAAPPTNDVYKDANEIISGKGYNAAIYRWICDNVIACQAKNFLGRYFQDANSSLLLRKIFFTPG